MQLAATPANSRLVMIVAKSLAKVDPALSPRDHLLGAKADFVKADAALDAFDGAAVRIEPIQAALQHAADGAAKLIRGGAKETLVYNDAWIAMSNLDLAITTFGEESIDGSLVTRAVDSARTYLDGLAG